MGNAPPSRRHGGQRRAACGWSVGGWEPAGCRSALRRLAPRATPHRSGCAYRGRARGGGGLPTPVPSRFSRNLRRGVGSTEAGPAGRARLGPLRPVCPSRSGLPAATPFAVCCRCAYARVGSGKRYLRLSHAGSSGFGSGSSRGTDGRPPGVAERTPCMCRGYACLSPPPPVGCFPARPVASPASPLFFYRLRALPFGRRPLWSRLSGRPSASVGVPCFSR